LVSDDGTQLGVFTLGEAVKMARDSGLDLIQVTEKVDPPVCRLMDYGKFLYREKKKKKPQRDGQGEIKGIRLGFGISDHDMEIRAKQAAKFLQEGHKVKIELILRGREKALGDFAKEKFDKFHGILSKTTPLVIERELKREPRGLIMIVAKGTPKNNGALDQ
jgi:translation initiation factor IF-3